MMVDDCLFCKIIKGVIPSEKVFENDKVYAFKDIYPQAKEHYLFISKNHTKDMTEMPADEIATVMSAIQEFVKTEAIESFRIVTNIGELAGQTVFHTHFHLLTGEKLKGFGS